MLDLDRIKSARLGHILSGDRERLNEVRGERDGKIGQPAQAFSAYEEMRAEAVQGLSNFRADIKNQMGNLEKQISSLSKQHEDAENAARDLENQKSQRLNRINESLGYEINNTDAPLVSDLRRKQDALRMIDAEVNNRPMRGGNPFVYFVLMSFVALVEWPINRLAFEAAFQEAIAVASIIALAVGIGLAIAAHFSGLIARRMEYHGKTRSKLIKARVALTALLMFVLFVLYVIALSRHEYVKLLAQQNVSASALFRGDVVSAISEGFLSPQFTPSDWGLLVVNLLVFLIAFSISYSGHDPHPDYARATRELKRAQRKLEKAKRLHDRQYDEVSKELDERIRAARHTALALDRDRTAMQVDVKTLEVSIDTAVSQLAHTVARHVQIYIQANTKVRATASLPSFLVNAPTALEIQDEIRRALAQS